MYVYEILYKYCCMLLVCYYRRKTKNLFKNKLYNVSTYNFSANENLNKVHQLEHTYILNDNKLNHLSIFPA